MFKLLLLLTMFATYNNSSKVLVVFPFPSRSHSILGNGVVDALANANHQVTFVTAFPNNNTASNVREIDVSGTESLFPDTREHLEGLLNNTQLDLELSSFVTSLSEIFAHTIRNNEVQDLINDRKQQFDVVIIEWIFYEVFAGLAAVFNCPYIWVSSVDPHWRILALIDDLSNPSYTPDMMSDNIPPFTFVQRAKELTMLIIGRGLQYYLINSAQEEDYKKLLVPVIQRRGNPVPPLSDVLYNASLVLSNSHASIGKAISLPQNFIPVGGFHITRRVNSLPEDVRKLLDSAEDGLIYFSLGSNIKSKHLPEILKQNLLKMFSNLTQTVLWKFEEHLPGAPTNVHLISWAPQTAILAHPNCKIFITHGGLLSTTESVHFAKPIITIPIFGDQFNNAKRAVEKGFALQVDMSHNVANDIKIAIEEILNNASYSKRAKEISLIYHDRPVTPDKELVHWVEHVVRTQGALHLRSPALKVPWYQKVFLDLAIVLITILWTTIITIKVLISCFKRKKIKFE